jgi:hypothetical protein
MSLLPFEISVPVFFYLQTNNSMGCTTPRFVRLFRTAKTLAESQTVATQAGAFLF